MAHVGVTEGGLVEIVGGRITLLLTPREAKALLVELDRLMKWLTRQDKKK